ncbi:MAG: hypothetical protein ACLUOF_05015 [Ruminococcus sp.]
MQINKPTVSFFVLLVLTLPALLLQCFSGIGVGMYLIGWLLQRICHCERSFSWKKVGWFVTASAVILSAAAASGSREFHTVNVLRRMSVQRSHGCVTARTHCRKEICPRRTG